MVIVLGVLSESQPEDSTSDIISEPIYLDTSSMATSAAEFSTNLPIVVIDTNGQFVSQSLPVRSSFAVIGDGSVDEATNDFQDPVDVDCYADVNIRGHSSAMLSKKSYRITLYKNEDSDKEYDTSLMGMASESDWVLYGPYQDLTCMRNVLMYDIGRETMSWAPDTRYCELWLNGDYNGIYVMVETVKVTENRLDLATYSLITGESSFLLSRDISDSGSFEFSTYTNSLGLFYQIMSLKYPKSDTILDSQKKWVQDYIDEFERALYADYYLDDQKGYRSYIDLDSFATYFVLNEFSMNEDAGYHSTYCYRDIGGELVCGPIWDLNAAFNNYVFGEQSSYGFYIVDNGWFKQMCTDPDFVSAVVAKYRELRAGVLSQESTISALESYRAELGSAIERNDAVWAHYGNNTGLFGDSRKYANYDEAFEQLEDCIIKRGDWLDEHIEDLYLYCEYR